MSKEYTAYPIAEKTFAIEEKTAVNQGLCYLLCGEEKALLIDTGLGYKSLLPTVKQLTELPISVANTHAHVDHIGGNYMFDEIWFHEKDREVFNRHIDPRYTFGLLTEGMPSIIKPLLKLMTKKMLAVDPSGNYNYFDDSFVFDLGGRKIEVIPTPGHTPGSVCFLDRENRMLFSGDTLCERGVLLHFEECSPPEAFLESVKRISELSDEFDTIWPGHHGYPVDKSYIDEYLSCAQQIVDRSAEYKTAGGRRAACFGRIMVSVPKEYR